MKKKAGKINTGVLIGAGALLLLLATKQTNTKTQGNKPVYTALEFWRALKPYAIALSNKIGVPYLFIMSQIALETGFGKSYLFYKYFNVGGIKAVKGQKFIIAPTYEYIKGKKTKVNAAFAVYDNLAAGLVGYAGILQNRYFKKYTYKTRDAKIYANLLQSGKPKYATDINYLPKIYKLIDTAKKV